MVITCDSIQWWMTKTLLIVLSLAPAIHTWSVLDAEDRKWVEDYVQTFDMATFSKDVDVNEDGTVTLNEFLQVIKQSDSDEDGVVHECEWITYASRRYELARRISPFMYTDKDGLLNYTGVWENEISNMKGREMLLKDFTQNYLSYLRRVANRAYEAVNSAPRPSLDNPEISQAIVQSAAQGFDTDGNGFMEPADFDLAKMTLTRCQYVTSHVPRYGGTRWFFNHVFNHVDFNNDEMINSEDVYKFIRVADGDKNGRTSNEEVSESILALFRMARLQAGLEVKNPWKCPGLTLPPHSVALQYSLDANKNQDGEITPEEIVQFFGEIDDNGDNLIHLQAEWADKLVKRYGVHTNLALALVDAFDPNEDGVWDIRTESPWFSADLNLDGTASICEFMQVCQQWLDIGAKKLQAETSCDGQGGQEYCHRKEKWVSHLLNPRRPSAMRETEPPEQ